MYPFYSSTIPGVLGPQLILSIHLLKDIWVISGWELLSNKATMSIKEQAFTGT